LVAAKRDNGSLPARLTITELEQLRAKEEAQLLPKARSLDQIESTDRGKIDW